MVGGFGKSGCVGLTTFLLGAVLNLSMPEASDLYEDIQRIDGYDDDLYWVFDEIDEFEEELVTEDVNVVLSGLPPSGEYTLILPWDPSRSKEIAIEVSRIISVLDYYVYIKFYDDGYNVIVSDDPAESVDRLNVDGLVLVSKPDTGFLTENWVSREI